MQNLAGAIVEKAIGKSSIPPIPLISPNESVTVTVVSCAFASLVNVRLAAVMVSAVHGVLITADVPLKQYILHLNDLAPAEGKFLIADLDDRRVLVQPSRADAIRAEIERYQQSTQYVAPTTMTKQ